MDALRCFEQAVRETTQEALSAIFSTEATNILALNILALSLKDKALKGGALMQEFLISSSFVIYQLAFYFSLLNGGLVSVELAVSCMSAGR